jgi:hypothetical protein
MKKLPFEFPETMVEIEIFADVIYYIIYGNYNNILLFKDIMNEYVEKNKINKKYIVAKLNLPVANVCENLKNINYTNSLETIQCMVYADCIRDAKNMYALLCIDMNELKYPSIELDDDFDPEELIYRDIKKISYDYAKYIKKNIKLVDIAGKEDEILVYSCYIDKII